MLHCYLEITSKKIYCLNPTNFCFLRAACIYSRSLSMKTSMVMDKAPYSSSRAFSSQQVFFFFFIATKWEFFFRIFSTQTFGKLLSSKFSTYPNPGCLRIVFIKPNQMTLGISFSLKQLFQCWFREDSTVWILICFSQNQIFF